MSKFGYIFFFLFLYNFTFASLDKELKSLETEIGKAFLSFNTNIDSAEILSRDILKKINYYLKNEEEIPDSIWDKLLIYKVAAYNALGKYFMFKGIYDSSYYYYYKELDVIKQFKNPKNAKLKTKYEAAAYVNLGNILNVTEDYSGALDFYKKASELFKDVGDSITFLKLQTNVAYIFEALHREKDAKKVLLEVSAKMKDADPTFQTKVFSYLLELSIITKDTGLVDSTYIKLLRLIKNPVKIDKSALAYSYRILAKSYTFKNKLDSAKIYLNKSEEVIQKSDLDKDFYLHYLITKAEYLIAQNKLKDAEKILINVYKDKDVGIIAKRNALELLYKLSLKQNNKDKVIKYLKDLVALKDSIYMNSQLKQIGETFSRLELEKEMLKEHLQHKKEKELAHERIKRQRIIIYSGIAIIIIILIFSFLLLNRYKIIKAQQEELQAAYEEIKTINVELNQTNEELNQTNEKLKEAYSRLEQQKRIIEEKNKAIIDSIQAAKRIQDALLPPTETLKQFFADAFVLYKPRDIVSGDFYWIGEEDDSKYIAVADCTGHGIPAAFLSMLGQMGLNTALKELDNPSTDKVLTFLQHYIINALQRYSSANIDPTAGMEISLCRWKYKENSVEISNAGRFVFIKSNKHIALKKVAGERYAIGLGELWKMKRGKDIFTFSKYEYKLMPEEMITIYFTSDGYIDQFGMKKLKKTGELKMKKLGTKNFVRLIDKIADYPLEKQKIILEEFLKTWQGNLEQLDDITVVAIKIQYNDI